MYRKREPQWQKSEEMTKRFVGSERWGARRAPRADSVDGEVLPTMMGTRGTEEGEDWNALLCLCHVLAVAMYKILMLLLILMDSEGRLGTYSDSIL